MNNPRINYKIRIATSSILAFLYLLGIASQLPLRWIVALYIGCFVSVIWMVIGILRTATPSPPSFDQCFYLDRPDLGPSAMDEVASNSREEGEFESSSAELESEGHRSTFPNR